MPLSHLVDNADLRRTVNRCLWVLLGMVFLFGLLAVSYFFLEDYNDSHIVSGRRLRQMERLLDSLGALGVLIIVMTFFGTGMLLVIWVFRCYRNLKRLDLRLQFAPGAAIFAWFIPLANSVLPAVLLQNMTDCYGKLLELFPEQKETLQTRSQVIFYSWIWISSFILLLLGPVVMASLFEQGNPRPVLAYFLFILFIGNISIIKFVKLMGKWEDKVLAMWARGDIEDYRYRASEPKEEAEGPASWFQSEQEYETPEGSFFDIGE